MRLMRRSESGDAAAFDARFVAAGADLRTPERRQGMLPPPIEARLLSLPRWFDAEFWLAEGPHGVVGRIGASLSPVHPDAGYFGFLEVDPTRPDSGATAELMLAAAGAWIAGHGRASMVGPMMFHTWLPYRYRVDGRKEQFAWEPGPPPVAVDELHRAGFEVEMRYRSTAVEGLDALVAHTAAAHHRAIESGFTMVPADPATFQSAELHAITMAAFADAHRIEPIPQALFDQINLAMAARVGFQDARLAFDPAGRLAGYFFAFEEAGSPAPWLVWKTIALRHDVRGQGLSNALFHDVLRAAVARGIDRGIAALTRDGVQSESYARKCRPLWRHEYALFRKPLTGAAASLASGPGC